MEESDGLENNVEVEPKESIVDKDLSSIAALKTVEDLNLFPDVEDPVYQTDFTPERGNALQACFAAMFRLELQKVPNFVLHPGNGSKILRHGNQYDPLCLKRSVFILSDPTDGYEVSIGAWLSTQSLNYRKITLSGGILQESDVLTKFGVPYIKYGTIAILRGKSPRGEHGHVVIAKVDASGLGFDFVHDPHPDSTFIDGQPSWAMFM